MPLALIKAHPEPLILLQHPVRARTGARQLASQQARKGSNAAKAVGKLQEDITPLSSQPAHPA